MEAVALQQRRKCIARRMATCVGMPVKPVVDALQFREHMALPVGALAILLVDPPGHQRGAAAGTDTADNRAVAGDADGVGDIGAAAFGDGDGGDGEWGR